MNSVLIEDWSKGMRQMGDQNIIFFLNKKCDSTRCVFVCGRMGFLITRITILFSIQTRTLLKLKWSNVPNYIKHKLRPSLQTEACVYAVCNEAQTSTNAPPTYSRWRWTIPGLSCANKCFLLLLEWGLGVYCQWEHLLPRRKGLSHTLPDYSPHIYCAKPLILEGTDRDGQWEVRSFAPVDICPYGQKHQE